MQYAARTPRLAQYRAASVVSVPRSYYIVQRGSNERVSVLRTIKVAYLVYGAGLGGGETLLVNHLLHANRSAFAPLVVATEDGALVRRLREIGVEVVLIPLHRAGSFFGRLSRPYLRTVLQLARVITRAKCGLIHSYTLETRNYAHAAALLTGIPLIHTSQDTWFGSGFSRLQWWAMNRIPKRIIATSEVVSRSLYVGDRLDRSIVRIIKPGIDISTFCEDNDRTIVQAELGIAPEVPVIGMVARYSADKGFDTFFAAAEIIVRNRSAATFLVVGGAVLRWDHYGPEIERLIAHHELRGHVVLTGFRSDVPRLIRAMDVLVSASPRESFGLTLAEAAACARPVVATRSGGSEEVVIEHETGLLVPPGEPEALANAIVELLDDPQRAESMGRAARERAIAEFDIRRMVQKIETEYEAVLRQTDLLSRH